MHNHSSIDDITDINNSTAVSFRNENVFNDTNSLQNEAKIGWQLRIDQNDFTTLLRLYFFYL